MLSLLLAFASCRHVGETMSQAEQEPSAGFYKSTTWVEPGAGDGGVDVLALGGFIEVHLYPNMKMEGRVFIPPNRVANYFELDAHVEGTYAVSGDTVHFNVEYLPDKARWLADQNKIETFEAPPRGRPYKIILAKQQRPSAGKI